MRKSFLSICLIGLCLLGLTAAVAAAPQLVTELDIAADNALNPMDYAFFDQPAPGRVELSSVKNLWGAGAEMIFYVETEAGPDWLMLEFNNTMVELKLQNKKLPLFSERLSAIKASTPLVLTINDGILQASIGRQNKTVAGITAFKGSLTTQSIEAKLKAYRFPDGR